MVDVEVIIEEYLQAKYQKSIARGNNTSLSNEALLEKLGDFLTVEDLMKLLKVSRPVITKYLKDGELPAAKIGNQYRVYKRDFIKWWNGLVQQNNIKNAEEMYKLFPDPYQGDPMKVKKRGRKPGGYKYK